MKLGLQGRLLDLPFPKSRVNFRFKILSSFTYKGGPQSVYYLTSRKQDLPWDFG